MNIVLLSGGSGKRLWPISNDARSKQFLKVLEKAEGLRESMVQRVWGQLKSVGLSGTSVIATSKAQVEMIQSQLENEVTLIVEPERRDTFPAIALASTYLYSVKGLSLSEVISVLPVDPFVDDDFFEKVKELEETLLISKADLALMGVTPTFPSEKYGYIVPQTERQNEYEFLHVDHFREKPTQADAQKLIASGALWNCGVFAFKLEKIINIIKEKGFPVEYKQLIERYSELPKISFDYEVVEKSSSIVVSQYHGSWKDLGTWNTLTEEMATNMIGYGVISDECKNVHVVNELDIPLAVLGISDAVIAASPDGILISDKNASPRVKEIANFNLRPMYEERLWGWTKVLDFTKNKEGDEVLTKKVGINAGRNLSYQLHHNRKEVWTIISGEGLFVLEGCLITVKVGDVLEIPPESRHAIKAITDLVFIEVQSGKHLVAEDVVRLCMSWEEILGHIKEG